MISIRDRGVINAFTYISGRQHARYFNGPYQQTYAENAQLSSGELSCCRHHLCVVYI